MPKSNPDPFYAWLDNEQIRDLVHRAGDLTPGERLVLLKGLVPGLVAALGEDGFGEFLDEIRVKARRYTEAQRHPGEGHQLRETPGEPLGGPTPQGHVHFDGHRDPHREGGRAAERREEAEVWARRRNEEGGSEDGERRTPSD